MNKNIIFEYIKRHIKIAYMFAALIVGIAAILLVINFVKQKEASLGKFPKGLLAINIGKSIYMPGEKVEFEMASLDSKGNTLCHSNLQIDITTPRGQKISLTTKGGNIDNSTTCSENNNVTNDPDYRANFVPEETGTYSIELTNLDTKLTVKDQLIVKSDQKLNIERNGATRVNPFKSNRYPMTLTISAQEDFNGQVVEQIPSSFDVIWQGPSEVKTETDHKTITWNVNMKAGDSKDLIYEYEAPQVSPGFFTLGKASLVGNGNKVFEETRQWQIASDLVDFTFVNATSGDNSAVSSLIVSMPTNTTKNDMMFAIVMSFSSPVSGTPPGWTLIASNSANTDRYYLYNRLAGTGESGPYTWTTSANTKLAITVTTYRGAFDVDHPIDVISNTQYRTSNALVSAATMTTTSAASPLVFFGGVYSTTVRTFTTPSAPARDWVENVDTGQASSSFSRTVDSMIWAGSGATNSMNGSASATSTTKHAFAVALHPEHYSYTTYTSSGTWIAPANVYQVSVQVRGGGAAGSPDGASASYPGGGGGGGAFAEGLNVVVTPGSSYNLTIGAQVSSGDGNLSRFEYLSGSYVTANGGTSSTTRTGGAGGTASAISGYTTSSYAGGAGGTASSTVGYGGGGGGEGASSGGVGIVGAANSTTTGGAGGSGGDGGDGGKGGNVNAAGVGGSAPGGGGGGAGANSNTQGAGARGEIRLMWNLPPTVALNISDGYNFGTNSTPTLSFTGSDPEADYLEYNAQISTGSDFSGGGSGINTSLEYTVIGYDTRTNTTINKPTNTADGDFLIANIYIESVVIAVTAPAGWTLLASGTALDSSFTSITYYKRASSEGASWTWTHSSAFTNGFVKRYTGVVSAGNPEDCVKSSSAGNSATPVWPGITTNTNGAALVGIEGFYDGTSSRSASTLTERVDDASIFLQSDTDPTAGATGNLVATESGGVDQWVTTFIALKPQGSGVLIDKTSTTDPGFTVGHPFTSSSTISYTVQSPLDDGLYYWRVRATDPTGSSTYGVWSETRTFVVLTKYTVSGTIYQPNESSPYQCATSGNLTVYLRVNNSGTYSAPCNADTGVWSVPGVSIASGSSVFAYLSGGSVRGSTVFISSGTNVSDLPIIQNAVVLRNDNGSITNTLIGNGDTSDSNDLITLTGGSYVTSGSYETHIYTGDTFAPGGNVTTGKLHMVGNYTGNSDTLTLLASGTGVARPLYKNGGTFTAPTNIIFQGSGPSDIESTTVNNLSFTPTISASVPYTFLGNETINGDFTINPNSSGANPLTVNLGGNVTVASTKTTTISGSTSALSALDTMNGINYSLSTGFLNIAGAGTLNARGSNFTLTGTSGTIFTRTGVFNPGTSTVTFSQASGNTTLNSGAITFNNLNVLPSANSVTSSFGNGAITVNGDVSLGTGTNTGVVIENTSGDANITVNGYVSVDYGTTFVNSDDVTKSLDIGGNLIITGTFVAPAGTTDSSFTLAGNFTKNGTFTANGGKLTLVGTGTSYLIYNSDTSFYQFSVLSASGGKAVKFEYSFKTIITNDITIQGASCNSKIYLDSLTGDSPWVLNINSGATQNIDYIDLQNADATGTQVTPVADNSTETGSNTGWTVNMGECTPPPVSTNYNGLDLNGLNIN